MCSLPLTRSKFNKLGKQGKDIGRIKFSGELPPITRDKNRATQNLKLKPLY